MCWNRSHVIYPSCRFGSNTNHCSRCRICFTCREASASQTQVVWDAEASRQVKQIRQREQWLVLLPNRHEGYITWERFQHIQEMISSNAMVASPENPGAVKKGP